MPSHVPDPDPARPAGLQPLLARLKSMVQSLGPEGAPGGEEVLPEWGAPATPPPAAGGDAPASVPVALPVTDLPDDAAIPLAQPLADPAAGAVPVALPGAAPAAEAAAED